MALQMSNIKWVAVQGSKPGWLLPFIESAPAHKGSLAGVDRTEFQPQLGHSV